MFSKLFEVSIVKKCSQDNNFRVRVIYRFCSAAHYGGILYTLDAFGKDRLPGPTNPQTSSTARQARRPPTCNPRPQSGAPSTSPKSIPVGFSEAAAFLSTHRWHPRAAVFPHGRQY